MYRFTLLKIYKKKRIRQAVPFDTVDSRNLLLHLIRSQVTTTRRMNS